MTLKTNLMYGNIVELLEKHHNLSLEVICHQPLYALIRDTRLLDEKLERYAKHQATHIDFVLYNRISKLPVLAIEVDGFSYHKPGSEQYARDLMKDSILELYKIPLFRFPTYGSEEREKIERFLTAKTP